jgi:hypothetical protein
MIVHYESTGFGEVRASAIHGRPAVGSCELVFVATWLIQATRKEAFSIFGTAAWISVQVAGTDSIQYLGQAVPETAWTAETRDAAHAWPLQYRLPVSFAQMLALEEVRRGQELVFHVDMRGNSYGSRGIRTFAETSMLRVTASDWSRVLREAQVAEVLLVGVHLPAHASDARFKAAIELVRRANEQLVLGHYSAAVAECRLALESLWRAASLSDRARDARKQLVNMNGQLGLSKLGRELALGEALRIFCHSAHHVRGDSMPEEFGRLDAALAVGTTAALVSSLVAAPSRLDPEPAVPALEAQGSASVSKDSKPQDNPLQVKAGKVVTHLRDHPDNRPSTLSALSSVIESLFGKKLSAADIDALVHRLKDDGVVKVNGKKVTYKLPPKGK